MRKTLPYALLAAFCAILLAAPLEGGGVMLVGMRNAMLAGGGGWKNPYVTDGLVAMWDGEWNAGGGVHDPNATTWIDLSGNGYDFTLPSAGVTFSGDSINLAGTSISTNLPEISRSAFTIEVVAESTGTQGAWVWMKNPSWAGGALIGLQSSGICYFPWYNIGRTGDQSLSAVELTWDSSQQVLYKNASALATTSNSVDSRNVLSTIYIGEYNGNKKSTVNCHALRLYSRALTAQEIAANYAVDKARFNLA